MDENTEAIVNALHEVCKCIEGLEDAIDNLRVDLCKKLENLG